jgi:hypothetical protein
MGEAEFECVTWCRSSLHTKGRRQPKGDASQGVGWSRHMSSLSHAGMKALWGHYWKYDVDSDEPLEEV